VYNQFVSIHNDNLTFSIFCKTKYCFVTVPTAAPTLRLSSSTPSSIYIEWDLLPKEKCNGVITGYKIFLINGGQEVIENVSASNRSFIFRGTVKLAHVVTSIKQSPVLRGHIFLVQS